MKKQLVGFILFLFFCVLVPLGVNITIAIYNLAFRSFTYPARWKRDVYLYRQKGRDPSIRCNYVYLPPSRDEVIPE